MADRAEPNSVPKQKRSSLLAAQIRSDILSKELPPGTELPVEAELIRVSGASRATVREALRILEHEGLITIRRGVGGGSFVARPEVRHTAVSLAALLSVTDARLRDLFEFRRLVEPDAARLTAERRSDATAADLVVLSKTPTLGARKQFHQRLADECGNRVLLVVLEATYHVFGTFTIGTDIIPEEVERATADHRVVAEAIRRRDGGAAAAAMLGHLVAWEQRLEASGRLDDRAIAPTRWRTVI